MSKATDSKPTYRKRHLFPRSFASIVDTITTPMLNTNQRMLRMLIKDWRLIVGDEIAACTKPTHLQFRGGKNTDGILSIRTPAHKAPEIPYLAPQILEALARHIGFRAIGRIVVDPSHEA